VINGPQGVRGSTRKAFCYISVFYGIRVDAFVYQSSKYITYTHTHTHKIPLKLNSELVI
jgi:hypothetical protein